MTALVGVLNKRGAAIAADSAIMVFGNGSSKIYNNEQKIFRISDQNPVGVMICNNLNFLTTPWALIFELYKAERGDKKCQTLTGYITDLLDYLKSLKRLQAPVVKNVYYQNEFDQVISILDAFYEEERGKISEENRNLSNIELSRLSYKRTLDTLKDVIYDEKINARLKGFTKKEFVKEVVEPNKEYLAEHRKSFPLMSDPEWDILLDCFHRYLQNNTFELPQGSEIIFVGYGEDDYFPSSQRLFISGMVGNEIKYDIEEISEITLEEEAEIRPFAQTDVMLTLMRGASPILLEEMREAALEAESNLKKSIIKELEKNRISADVINKVKNISLGKINEEFEDRINYFINENFVNGILQVVKFFNLEEMASMAENLIAVTNLQRHISSTEESVGGNIEVAVITRCGGFQWIKHNNFSPR